MDLSHIVDWASLAVRWLHVIAGAAWIGTSFYFNWLNNSVRAPDEAREGVAGELWAIHGGRFYQVTKYAVAPPRLPKTLHWFKWEAYVTWISGIGLLLFVYYVDTSVYMVDARVRSLSGLEAVGIGTGTLLVAWLLYHYLMKSPIGRMPVVVAILGFGVATAAAWGLTETLGSRAAYIHVGAMLGTLMAANVFFVIIPNQRRTVALMEAGKDPDPEEGRAAAQRSLHNNYMTLPVLFIMVSNHYPMTYGHDWNWAVLAGISLAGAGIRHWFNLRGMGEKNVWVLPAAAVAMVALAFVTAPKSYADHRPVTFEEVRAIVESRCLTCHSETPTHVAFQSPPGGVMLDGPDQIGALAPRINNVVVASRTMPLGNMTDMTEEERDVIGAWYFQGADATVPP